MPRCLFSESKQSLFGITKAAAFGGNATYNGNAGYAAASISGGNFSSTVVWSTSFWYKGYTGNRMLSPDQNLVSRYDSTAMGWRISLSAYSTSTIGGVSEGVWNIRLTLLDSTGGILQIESPHSGNVNDGLWHHIVTSYHGDKLAANTHIYIDGTLQTNVVVSNTLSGNTSNSGNFAIASQPSYSQPRPLNGYLKNILVIPYEATQSDVTTWYNSGTPYDMTKWSSWSSYSSNAKTILLPLEVDNFASGGAVTDASNNGYVLTPTNTTQYSLISYPKTIVTLNGSSQNITGFNSALDEMGNTAFSVNIWCKSSDTTDTMVPWGTQVTSPSRDGWEMIHTAGGATYWFGAFNAGSNSIYQSLAGCTQMSDGNWHMWTATYDGSGNASGIKLYIDATLISSSAGGTTMPTRSTARTATIGSRTAGDRWYNGSIASVSKWAVALTLAQIQELFSLGQSGNLASHSQWANLNGQTRGGWWTFEDPDSSANGGTCNDNKTSGTLYNGTYNATTTGSRTKI